MQLIIPALPWCVKDSHTFRDEVVCLRIPPGAQIFTFDAVSMYSNINLNHALPIMKSWFESYVSQPGGKKLANTNVLMSALTLVMKWNTCKFGDSYLKQKVGTSMGTSCAVFFANLYYFYFGFHKKNKLLPKYQAQLKRMPIYRRFIDDVFGIWIGNCGFLEWAQMIHDFNDFGILKWELGMRQSSTVC